MKKKILAAVITMTITGLANAQDINLDQQGQNNQATINQTGNSSISVSQYGLNGMLTVTQDSDASHINVTQEHGYDNYSGLAFNVTQTGTLNSGIDVSINSTDDSINIKQENTTDSSMDIQSHYGTSSDIDVYQQNADQGSHVAITNRGDDNWWDVNQQGSGNNVDVFAGDESGHYSVNNTAHIAQAGSNNSARFHVEGSYNNINFNQQGNDGHINISLHGWDDSLPNPDPAGCPDCTGAMAGEASGNTINVMQNGDGTSLQLWSNASYTNNTFNIEQYGTNNSIEGGLSAHNGNYTMSQHGTDGYMNVHVGGDFNTLAANDFGGNNINLNQYGNNNHLQFDAHNSGTFFQLDQHGSNNSATITAN